MPEAAGSAGCRLARPAGREHNTAGDQVGLEKDAAASFLISLCVNNSVCCC